MAKQTAAPETNRRDFFKKRTEAALSQGLIVSETPYEVLVDLSAGKFKDAASESLGEELECFVVKYARSWGVPPWNKDEDAQPEFYGELWIVPVSGKLGKEAGNLVCKLLKPIRQLRFFEQQATKLLGSSTDFREVVWMPKFEAKSGTDRDGKPIGYYQMKWNYRFPMDDAEEKKLDAIVTLLERDENLEQLRDSSTGLLYLDDLDTEQRKALVASMVVVKPQLPALPATTAIAQLPAVAVGVADEF